jgi:hypothetical protein
VGQRRASFLDVLGPSPPKLCHDLRGSAQRRSSRPLFFPSGGLAVYGQKILVGDGKAAYTFNLNGTGKTRMFNYTQGYGVGAGCVFTYDYQASTGGGGGGGGAPASPSSAVRLRSVFQGLWQANTN